MPYLDVSLYSVICCSLNGPGNCTSVFIVFLVKGLQMKNMLAKENAAKLTGEAYIWMKTQSYIEYTQVILCRC